MTSILSLAFSHLYLDELHTISLDNHQDHLKSYELELDSILKQWLEAPTNELDFKAQQKLYKDTKTLLNELERLSTEEQHSLQEEALKLFTNYPTESWEKSAKWIGCHNEAYSPFRQLITFCALAQDKDSEDLIPEDVNQAVLCHMKNHPFQLSQLPPELLHQLFFTGKDAQTIIKQTAKAKRISKSIHIEPRYIKKLVIIPIIVGSRLKQLQGITPQLKTLKFNASKRIDTPSVNLLSTVKSISVQNVRESTFLESLKDDLQKLKLSKIYQKNLDQLGRFTGLKTLKLTNAYELYSVDFLKKISNELEMLELSNAPQIGSFDAIAHLSGLTSLNLSKNELTDLDFLSNLTKLKYLDVSECRYVTNLKALEDCASLKTLNLTLCVGIKDFRSLLNLPALKNINITGCQIPQQIVDSLKDKGVIITNNLK